MITIEVVVVHFDIEKAKMPASVCQPRGGCFLHQLELEAAEIMFWHNMLRKSTTLTFTIGWQISDFGMLTKSDTKNLESCKLHFYFADLAKLSMFSISANAIFKRFVSDSLRIWIQFCLILRKSSSWWFYKLVVSCKGLSTFGLYLFFRKGCNFFWWWCTIFYLPVLQHYHFNDQKRPFFQNKGQNVI